MSVKRTRKPEGRFALYTDAGLVASGVTKKRAQAMAKRITRGSATVATSSGTALEQYVKGKRVNPGGKQMKPKKPNKLQRLMSSTKRSKQKRMAKALNEYLKVRNPGTKLAGAKVIKNAGGSITIIPIKLRRAK